MLLGSPIIIVLAVIGVAWCCYRKCDDCTAIDQCRGAMNLIKSLSEETRPKVIKKSLCEYRKVCCSDFCVHPQTTHAPKSIPIWGIITNHINNQDNINNDLNNKYEKDNHIISNDDDINNDINKDMNNGINNDIYNDKNIDENHYINNDIDNDKSNRDEIEGHPNIKLLPEECGLIEGSRIIGGIKAKLNEFPWLAIISAKSNGEKQFICGGTVINERYVLTAAHCIQGKHVVDVRIGEYNINTTHDCIGSGTFRICQSYLQNIRVSKKLSHSDYVQRPKILNDIGLLRLRKRVNLKAVNAGVSCLPWPRHLRRMNMEDKEGIVAGWGLMEDGKAPDVLRKVTLPIVDKNTCYSYHGGNPSTSNHLSSAFCAGNSGHDSCSGDSGGPLMVEVPYTNGKYRLVQFGIVSYGMIDCGSRVPGVYTEVSKFMKWILDNIKP